MLCIHKTLRIIFPHDRDLAYKWVSIPSRRFEGKKPLEIMTRDYEGLLAVALPGLRKRQEVYP